MLYSPRASAELADGYRAAATLALRRCDECRQTGREDEIPSWEHIAQYCLDMAISRAVDDDQFRFQQDKFRHTKEIPMTEREMDVYGLSIVGASRDLPEWQWAAFELAMGYLSPLQRVCFEMHVAGRLSHRNIGDALNMSRNDASKHFRRAKKIFKTRVRPVMEHIFAEHRRGVGQDCPPQNAIDRS